MRIKLLSNILVFLLFLLVTSCSVDEESNVNETSMPDKIDLSPEDIDYSIRFGVGAHIYPKDYTSVQEVYAGTRNVDGLGYVFLRHPGSGIAWFEVQPTYDTWNFEKLDAVLKDNKHPWIFPIYGMVGNVYPFGGFSKTELESNDGTKEDVISYITEHTIDMSDPQIKEDAEIFVKVLVDRYKDHVKYWEIGGNEGLPAPEKYGIISNTYPWIKETDPDAQVLVTANSGDGDWVFYDNINALDNILAQGATESFDIANFHYYGYITGDFEERLEERYGEYVAVLDKYGVDKPIWVTETGTCADADSEISPGADEFRQAQDVLKRLAIYTAKGAEKVFWYSYGGHTTNDLFYGCGLVDRFGNKRPAYYNFKLMVDKVGFYDTVEKLRGDGVWLFKYINPDNSEVYVAWAKSGTENLDLSSYVNEDKVTITYIIENSGVTEHDTSNVDTNSIELNESPVIIEI